MNGSTCGNLLGFAVTNEFCQRRARHKRLRFPFTLRTGGGYERRGMARRDRGGRLVGIVVAVSGCLALGRDGGCGGTDGRHRRGHRVRADLGDGERDDQSRRPGDDVARRSGRTRSTARARRPRTPARGQRTRPSRRRSTASRRRRRTTTASWRRTAPARRRAATGCSRRRRRSAATSSTGAAAASRARRPRSTARSTRTAVRRPGTSSTARARGTARGPRSRTRARARRAARVRAGHRADRPARPTTSASSGRATRARASGGGQDVLAVGAAPGATRGRRARVVVGRDAARHRRPGRSAHELALRVGHRARRTARTPPPASAGSGTKSVAVTAALTGLAAGTTYHFRLVATNASGTTTGADRTFATTRPARPPRRPGRRRASGRTSATMTGTRRPERPAHELVLRVRDEHALRLPRRRRRTRLGNRRARRSAPAVSGLSAGATYHFRLVASSSGGTSRGADVTLRRRPAPR